MARLYDRLRELAGTFGATTFVNGVPHTAGPAPAGPVPTQTLNPAGPPGGMATGPGINLTAKERELLARMVFAEAAGQPFEGQQATANVALNRVAAGDYGGSDIEGVVTAKTKGGAYQFEGLGRPGIFDMPISHPSLQAVLAAVDAAAARDVTGGSTYFINKDLQQALGRGVPGWAQGDPTLVIGDHAFYGGNPLAVSGGSPLTPEQTLSPAALAAGMPTSLPPGTPTLSVPMNVDRSTGNRGGQQIERGSLAAAAIPGFARNFANAVVSAPPSGGTLSAEASRPGIGNIDPAGAFTLSPAGSVKTAAKTKTSDAKETKAGGGRGGGGSAKGGQQGGQSKGGIGPQGRQGARARGGLIRGIGKYAEGGWVTSPYEGDFAAYGYGPEHVFLRYVYGDGTAVPAPDPAGGGTGGPGGGNPPGTQPPGGAGTGGSGGGNDISTGDRSPTAMGAQRAGIGGGGGNDAQRAHDAAYGAMSADRLAGAINDAGNPLGGSGTGSGGGRGPGGVQVAAGPVASGGAVGAAGLLDDRGNEYVEGANGALGIGYQAPRTARANPLDFLSVLDPTGLVGIGNEIGYATQPDRVISTLGGYTPAMKAAGVPQTAPAMKAFQSGTWSTPAPSPAVVAAGPVAAAASTVGGGATAGKVGAPMDLTAGLMAGRPGAKAARSATQSGAGRGGGGGGYGNDSRVSPDAKPGEGMGNFGGLYSRGGPVPGGGFGQQDNVPAMLSAGEFVIPADVVSGLGDGNTEAGATQLERMVAAVRGHRAGAGHPPRAKGIGEYLKAGR